MMEIYFYSVSFSREALQFDMSADKEPVDYQKYQQFMWFSIQKLWV